MVANIVHAVGMVFNPVVLWLKMRIPGVMVFCIHSGGELLIAWMIRVAQDSNKVFGTVDIVCCLPSTTAPVASEIF